MGAGVVLSSHPRITDVRMSHPGESSPLCNVACIRSRVGWLGLGLNLIRFRGLEGPVILHSICLPFPRVNPVAMTLPAEEYLYALSTSKFLYRIKRDKPAIFEYRFQNYTGLPLPSNPVKWTWAPGPAGFCPTRPWFRVFPGFNIARCCFLHFHGRPINVDRKFL